MIIVKYQSGRDKQGFAATTEQAEQGPSEPMRAWVMEPEWDRVSQREPESQWHSEPEKEPESAKWKSKGGQKKPKWYCWDQTQEQSLFSEMK